MKSYPGMTALFAFLALSAALLAAAVPGRAAEDPMKVQRTNPVEKSGHAAGKSPHHLFEPPGYRLDGLTREMHRFPRHELHHPGPGHDGQGPGLLVHHGEHAQPHGVRRAPPGARRGDRPPDPGGTDGVGRHVQSALRIALFGRTAHPRGLFRPPLDQAEFPRRRRPRLFQPRRPRPGRPDAPDPGQVRHSLHGHEPLP